MSEFFRLQSFPIQLPERSRKIAATIQNVLSRGHGRLEEYQVASGPGNSVGSMRLVQRTIKLIQGPFRFFQKVTIVAIGTGGQHG